MTNNARAETVTLLRRVASQILDVSARSMMISHRAEVLTGGQGFEQDDFDYGDARNSYLSPPDFVALEHALGSLRGILYDAAGNPTEDAQALIRFAEAPTV